MTIDRYPAAVEANQPARLAFAITPDNNTDLDRYAKALYIGTSGDVTVITAGDVVGAGTPVLFKAVPIGVLPVQVRRVMLTGTGATNIVGLTD